MPGNAITGSPRETTLISELDFDAHSASFLSLGSSELAVEGAGFFIEMVHVQHTAYDHDIARAQHPTGKVL